MCIYILTNYIIFVYATFVRQINTYTKRQKLSSLVSKQKEVAHKLATRPLLCLWQETETAVAHPKQWVKPFYMYKSSLLFVSDYKNCNSKRRHLSTANFRK